MQDGILSGVDEIIDEILEVKPIGNAPYYHHKTACDQLHRVPLKGFAADLLTKVYDQIETNWEKRAYKKPPSKKNWRFLQNKTIDKENKSLEIQLQRAIVNINQNMWPDAKNWANHVPTASGLCGHACDKHRAIDLVHVYSGQNSYETVEFIELKVDTKSGHPLYAAIEVLLYGMLYVFSRRRLKELEYDVTKQPLLQASAIHLVVLAPCKYYEGYQFEWLEKEITTELTQFIREPEGYKMDFQFQSFPRDCSVNKIISDQALLIEALASGALAVPQSWAGKSKTRKA